MHGVGSTNMTMPATYEDWVKSAEAERLFIFADAPEHYPKAPGALARAAWNAALDAAIAACEQEGDTFSDQCEWSAGGATGCRNAAERLVSLKTGPK